jgi:hypothetical protein
MSSAIDYNAFDRGVDPLLRLILSTDNAQSILQYEPDSWLQARIEELACKSNEGELSDEEQSELEGYVRANNFVAILRSKARNVLDDLAE